ncbi:MAG: DUF3024 domain-containing protein [Anaerolineae bacterium]|nr:DUF3024 domain-containing protein [Anaerolineae bacterium]
MVPKSISEICQIARKALKVGPDNEDAWRGLAKSAGLTASKLGYYCEAYAMAGESGVRSLSTQNKIPDDVRENAMARINAYLARKVPPPHRDKIGFMVKYQRGRITVSEKRPHWKDPAQTTCRDFVQLRYTVQDSRWHLYWKRGTGEWWPYAAEYEVRTVDDCLEELDQDGRACFWG